MTTLTFSLPDALSQRIRERSELTGYPMSTEIVAALTFYYEHLNSGYAFWANRLTTTQIDLLKYYASIETDVIVHTLRLLNFTDLADALDAATPVYIESLRALLKARIQQTTGEII